MAFGDLAISKTIAMNAPKYSKVIEPFGDSGTFAMYPGKKKPKEHILNIEDEIIFSIYNFLQSHTGSDKSKLKKMDWVSSIETFTSVLAIKATEGADLFYRFFYLKKFGVRSKEEGVDPTYDALKYGKDMGNIIYLLPSQKVGLKGVTIINGDPLSAISGSGGFMILAPKKPEHVESVDKQMPLSGDFFYAKKAKDNETMMEAANSAGASFVTHFAQSAIMMGTMQVTTNYETKLPMVPLDETGVLNA